VTSNAGGPSYAVRQLFARHLIGTGLELGALHSPFTAPLSAIDTKYVDRWTPEEAKELFPELGEVDFAAADHIVDLNTEKLSAIGDGTQDFVVASHVLEHVANPLALLVEMHRVLRPGGTAIVLLPDMRRTSDRFRQPTTVEHLVDEYERDVQEVDEAHLADYARDVMQFKGEGAEREEFLARLAQRSIHVHMWAEEDFFAALRHAVEHLGCRFELLELLQTEEYERNIEFGYVLRRTTADVTNAALAVRLVEQKALMVEHRASRGWTGTDGERRIRELEAALDAAERRNALLQRQVSGYDAWLGPLRRSPVWPAARRARRELAKRRSGAKTSA
jgi:SAM-dependent methyltransferase